MGKHAAPKHEHRVAPYSAEAAASPHETATPRSTATSSTSAAPFPRTSAQAPSHATKQSRLIAPLRALGLAILAFALMGAGTVGALYYQLQHNIEQHAIARVPNDNAQSVIPLDQKTGNPINILLLGSDARPEGSSIGGMRSDTTMLMHISANRKRVDVISIPRDTLVPIPSCALPAGEKTKAQNDAMFNSAFMLGGSTGDVGYAASCTLATVEQMGDITIDGFAVVNFDSFQAVVNTIGGVDMCFLEDVKDREAALDIPAGCHTLDGTQALAIARARHSVGDGSDISRIGRQQELVFQIAKKLFSKNLFTDTQTFYQVAGDVTKNLDTSAGLGNLTTLTGLAYSIRDLDIETGINLMTLPVVPDTADPNRVREAYSSSRVWDAIRNDQPIPSDALVEAPEQNEVVVQNRQPQSNLDQENDTSTGTTGTDTTNSGSNTPRSSSSTTTRNGN